MAPDMTTISSLALPIKTSSNVGRHHTRDANADVKYYALGFDRGDHPWAGMDDRRTMLAGK
jgi:hypothetical protein